MDEQKLEADIKAAADKAAAAATKWAGKDWGKRDVKVRACLLYTSDAADD